MIEIQGLTKRYGNKHAIKDVSFTIKKGEILGFLGRNGAGKTTTMNIVTGYISASEGRVLLDGHDILEEPRVVKRRIGYLPEQPPLYMDMTVDEYLRFACAIKDVRPGAAKAHIDDVCELVKIQDVRKRLIKNLSKGYKQRVGLAQALIGNPEMIILDEPTVGLDPRQILEIRSLIKRLGQDHTVVLSSHILTEVADVCERVVIINNGKIVAQDTLGRLTSGVGDTFRITIRVAGQENEIKRALRALEGARYVESLGAKEEGAHDFVVETDRSADIRKPLFNALARAGLPILMLRPADITLEDIFLKLTSDNEEA
ncbi:MAG: ABC transporter ATP-binding protein [Oscillospiraceae bacterium]|jgi:ABC-2 type transport system ATP-binding protein|nr:ABC transporter ATP-binding protein [Oscillospiraceae bacterium]